MSGVKDYYVYPAIFDYADDGITIDFPDLPGCMPCAFSTEEAVHNAREAMSLHLYGMEEDGDEIPVPSDILSIKHENNQAVVLVDVSMHPVRERMRNKPGNKMCTVPNWLIVEAKEAGLNFSQTLQEALMQKLGIHRKSVRR